MMATIPMGLMMFVFGWAEVRGARAATPLGAGANPEGCQLELFQHGRHRGDGDGNLFQCPYLWELGVSENG